MTTGILAALRTRDATGEGQTVDVSLMHIGFYVLGNDAALSLVTRRTPERHDRRRPRNPLWNHYQTGDGRWIFLVMIESDRYWPRLARAIGRPELLEDERFAGMVPRYRNAPALVEILQEAFSSRTLADWKGILERHELIWAPVHDLAEAIQDEQARASGVFSTVEHPTAGAFETVAPPLRMSAHPMAGDRPAPALGADGERVLREAGLSDAEIAAALGSGDAGS